MANDEPTDIKGTSKKKFRSPAYPSVALPTAIDYAQRVWDSQRTHDAHFESVVHALGYSSISGASQRAVGALGHYGLTEDLGKADDRRLKLTELALDLLQLSKTDDRYRKALRTAALTPAIHAALWERYGAHPPSDESILPFLRRDKGYMDGPAADVISNYRATFEFAKLGEKEDVGGREDKKDVPPDPAAKQNPNLGFVAPAEIAPQKSPVTQELPILVDHGQVARIPFPMSEDAFELLMGTLQLWKKKLVPPTVIQPTAPVYQAFPVPIEGLWKNKDYDQPVRVVGVMRESGIEEHFMTETGTGIPASQVEFP